ncbi:hypothetical protein ACMGE6_12465 (plasmid) [Macrococcus equi]|uniref:hypothetical protein n=1 Tax=Macrococcus equi TaxID=3395462 RepID=UPI0039BDEEE0
MKNNSFTKVILASTMIATGIGSFSAPKQIEAATSPTQNANEVTPTQQDILKYDKYVSEDTVNNKFFINSNGDELNTFEKQKLQSFLDYANNQLAVSKLKVGINIISEPTVTNDNINNNQTSPFVNRAVKYKNGVTKVDFNWGYVRVYLSRDTLQYISGGIAIGGIWFPEPFVSKVISTLGVASGLAAKGGIRFDIKVTDLPKLTRGIPAFSNVHWQ